MRSKTVILLLVAGAACQAPAAQSTCPATPPPNPNGTIGACPQDFSIIGPRLQAVHESQQPPTGLAVDPKLNIYLTYPRNNGPTPNNVVIATAYGKEEPWPNKKIQNCAPKANVSECFINVQNVVLDSLNQMWVVDSGIPANEKTPVPYGAKIMVFDLKSRALIRSYPIPPKLLHDKLNANDLRINNTLGKGGWGFITDESEQGSIVVINLANGHARRRLFNTPVTKADPGFVGSYNGEPVYSWNGTQKSFTSTGSDGIALQSGNVYWGVLASRRFYYISQKDIINDSLTDAQVLAKVYFPGELGSEQAGFTADDRGRLYMTASEQNAIYYVDTLQSQVTEEVNGVPPGGSGPVKNENYVVKTLVRNAQIQHADSAAIYDGWLYFCTNQLSLSPSRQYNNVDARRGPFRSYRLWIGRGPAV